MAYYTRLASAILNDVYSGLRGYHTNMSMSVELLEDEIVSERLAIIKELVMKDALPKKELLLSLNCIAIDCKDLERCDACHKLASFDGTPTAHFEIPLLVMDFDNMGIEFIGSIDRTTVFTVYTSLVQAGKHKYRKRRALKPYVYVDPTPNENGLFDCFVFNAPFIKHVSVVGVFKDLRQVEMTNCCLDLSLTFTSIDTTIQLRLTERKIKYYRLLAALNLPNNLQYT